MQELQQLPEANGEEVENIEMGQVKMQNFLVISVFFMLEAVARCWSLIEAIRLFERFNCTLTTVPLRMEVIFRWVFQFISLLYRPY